MEAILGFRIEEPSPQDSAHVARLTNLWALEPVTPEEVLRRWDTHPKEDPYWRRGVYDADRMVAYLNCLWTVMADTKYFMLRMVVDPEYRARGIGAELLAACEQFATATLPNSPIRTLVRDDDQRSIQFAERSGYHQRQHLIDNVLQISDYVPEKHQATVEKALQSVKITTLAELGDTAENRRRLHVITRAADEDTPFVADWGLMDYAQYERFILDAKWFRPEGTFIALDGEEWVGAHTLGPTADPKQYSTDFTGVLRSHRGKGIALALKVRGIEWAQSNGATSISTQNDLTNAPMRKINVDLGFVQHPGFYTYQKMS